MFMSPSEWYLAELAMAANAVDSNPDFRSILYIVSSTGLVGKYGEAGANEALDRIEQFCMQLMWERRGAVRISVLADHGHNYISGRWFGLDDLLTQNGFRVTKRLSKINDVVMDIDGLMNYVGLHTRQPTEVADLLVSRDEVQIVAYQRDERIIIRNAHGSAAIERRDGRYRYVVINHDVLNYVPIIEAMRQDGRADAEGFAEARVWLHATHDLEYPDAPYRLWHAFHDLVVNVPDVMVTLRDGYYTGLQYL